MNAVIIYFFPFAYDIIVSVSLFAGRHSLAERGMDTKTVGSIIALYGISYIAASLFMGKIIKPALARLQMLLAVVVTITLLLILANTEQVRIIQALFCGIPLATCLFFNAFQSFMLGVDSTISKPLTKTISHYTFAWSAGYAIGPAISSLCKTGLGWSASYYAAAIAAAIVGIVALCFAPAHTLIEPQQETRLQNTHVRSLAVPAWITVLFGWTGWNMLVTCWPVQAQQLGYSTNIKGLVEFSFAITQAFTALLLSRVRPEYYQRKGFPLIVVAGIAGTLLFAAGAHTALFVAGAIAFGIYSGNFLCNMMFHSTIDPQKAVKRVAINEVCVGTSFLVAPFLAATLQAVAGGFSRAYALLSCILAAGAIIQAILIRLKLNTREPA